MPYIYNMLEGSFDQLQAEVTKIEAGPFPEQEYAGLGYLGGSDSPYNVRVLDVAVKRTGWPACGGYFDRLDWHETELLFEQADLIGNEISGLIGGLFKDPPLGIDPFGWGFHGSLSTADIGRLRELLEPVVGTEATRVASDRSLDADPLGWHDYAGPAWVLHSIRDVPTGRDVIVHLG